MMILKSLIFFLKKWIWILFIEDENVIVINKKQGIVVHPAEGNYSGTLVNGLIYYLKNHQKNFSDEPVRPGNCAPSR